MIHKQVGQPLLEPTKRRIPSSVSLRIGALCLTSAVTAVNYTNYGPLIPVLRSDLHISNGQAGLMSTLLFLGLAVMYIPAGALADRYGQRPVLIGSSILLAGGGVLLPLFPNFTWILLCRIIAGIGAGGAFVAGAGVAASMGKHSALAQGLYGGSVQIGSGLGLLFTPILYGWFGWRGAFFFWGLLAVSIIIIWLIVNDGQEVHTPTRVDI
jgi:MFS family permease